MKTKKYVIEKEETSASKYDTSDITDSYIQDTDTEDTSLQGGSNQYKSIVNVEYKKPRSGSRQDNMGTDEIKKKLEGFIPLRNMQEKRILTSLPLFKTWVRYINKETRQFRTGGLLMKVEYPNYVMLVNTNKNLSWSVQLDENILFIRDPKLERQKMAEKEREKGIKDKLYDMYVNGELKTKRN